MLVFLALHIPGSAFDQAVVLFALLQAQVARSISLEPLMPLLQHALLSLHVQYCWHAGVHERAHNFP